MGTRSLVQGLVGRLPLWPLVTLLIVTLCAASYGWALAAFSVPALLADALRLAFSAVGLEPRWGWGVGSLLGFLLCPLAVVPLFPAVAALADRPGESPVDSRVRVLHVLRAFWTTFLLQVLLVPGFLGADAAFEVCAPVREVAWPLAVRFFAYGLVESHAALFVLTLATYADGLRNLRLFPNVVGNRGLMRLLKGAMLGGLLWEAVVLLVLPAAVRWWLPVAVCPEGPHAECPSSLARGFDLTLCAYPGEYVAALYGNIALSVGGGLWAWRRGRRTQGVHHA